MAEYAVNTAERSSRANIFTLIWAGLYSSWLFYVYLGVRVFLLGLVWLVSAVWDLVSTIFAAFWAIWTNYRFLIAFAVTFIVLIFVHLYWSGFVHIIRDFIMPTLDILYNDVIKFLWNVLLLVIINLLIYVWDACVQLIGFFIYFALNIIITIAYAVVQILGAIHLGDFLEALMKVITPMVQIVVAVLQLLIKAGVALLKVALPIIIAILKIYIQYLKIIFKITAFLLITLFRALSPILKAVVAVVRFVTRVFFKKSLGITARVLLSVKDAFSRPSLNDTKESDRIYDAANRLDVFETYSAAMRYYSVRQFQDFLEQMEIVHQGIRGQDAFHSTDGYFTDAGDGVPDYNEGLYDESELEEHEKRRTFKRPKSQPSKAAAGPAKASTSRKLHGLLDEADMARNNLIDALDLINRKHEAESSYDSDAEGDDPAEEASATSTPVEGAKEEEEEEDVQNVGNEWRASKTLLEMHEVWRKNPDDWWRIDLSHNMTDEELFPHLVDAKTGKFKKLRRARLHELYTPWTPEEHHHIRKLATAYRHAVEHAMYRVHKRHIASGHLHRAIKNSWKQLTGHDDFDGWATKTFGNGRYVSAAHFIHSVVPDFTNSGIFKRMKEADPEHKTRLYHHDWMRQVCPECTDGVLPREVYEHLEATERWNEEQSYLNSGSGEPAFPLPGCEGAAAGGRTECLYGGEHRTGRKLHIKAKFEPFGLDLSFLYELDCFTTAQRNILCIPSIPDTWVLPYLDFKGVFFTDDLNNNTLCEPTWKSTDCIVCWEGVYNMFVELRFMIYWFDLVWKILVVGFFVPAPSEWIGYIGKVIPVLRPLTDWLLLYPPGEFPNGQAFACFFINLIYLFEFILILLIAYYIVNPLWQFARRQYWALWQLVVGIRFGLAARRDYAMFFNESYLARQKAEFREVYRRKLIARSRALNIGAEMGGGGGGDEDPEQQADEPEPHITSPIVTGMDSATLHRLMNEDPATASAIIDLNSEIERRSAQIQERLDRIGSRLGITDEEVTKTFAPHKKRPVWKTRMNRSWQRVTSVMHMPAELTPSYIEALIAADDKARKPVNNIKRNALKEVREQQ